jgi:hypothetical protein
MAMTFLDETFLDELAQAAFVPGPQLSVDLDQTSSHSEFQRSAHRRPTLAMARSQTPNKSPHAS